MLIFGLCIVLAIPPLVLGFLWIAKEELAEKAKQNKQSAGKAKRNAEASGAQIIEPEIVRDRSSEQPASLLESLFKAIQLFLSDRPTSGPSTPSYGENDDALRSFKNHVYQAAPHPMETHDDLSNRGPISAGLAAGKAIKTNKKTLAVAESGHDLEMAIARHANEVLDEAIKYRGNVEDLKLIPKRTEVKLSDLDAQVAENRARQAIAEAKEREARNPCAQQMAQTEKPQAPPKSDAERKADQWRSRMKSSGAGTSRDAQEILLKEFDEKHRNDPDFKIKREDFMEDLKRMRDEDAIRGGF